MEAGTFGEESGRERPLKEETKAGDMTESEYWGFEEKAMVLGNVMKQNEKGESGVWIAVGTRGRSRCPREKNIILINWLHTGNFFCKRCVSTRLFYRTVQSVLQVQCYMTSVYFMIETM